MSIRLASARCRAIHPPSGGVAPSRDAQGQAIAAFAKRFHDEMLAKRVPRNDEIGRRGWSIGDLVDKIGNALAFGLLKERFPLDPVGTFRVDQAQSNEIKRLIAAGLEAGAFVYVGGVNQGAVPTSLVDSRLRICYRLAPIYRLPLRNFRDVSLSTLLQRRIDPQQITMFDTVEG